MAVRPTASLTRCGGEPDEDASVECASSAGPVRLSPNNWNMQERNCAAKPLGILMGRVPRGTRAQVMMGEDECGGGGVECHTQRLFRGVGEHPHYPAPRLILLRQP